MSRTILNENEIIHAIGLTLLDGIGPVLSKKLIAFCGSAEAVFREKKQWLLKIPDIGPGRIEFLTTDVLHQAEKEMQYIHRNNIDVHYFISATYPQRLKYCDDSPLLLYSRGKMDLNAARIIAVVGTRNPTENGKQNTLQLVHALSSKNIMIVSGLAYGIDITVHRSCIQNNISTVGVLGHGLDRMYPFAHRSVAEKMLDDGGLLTEFASGTNPDRENFPKRNRIVAGMSDATIVMETSVKGGSMITAMLANDYNREVFAYPGRNTDEYSRGCNRLIRLNRAALVESAEDIIEMMCWQDDDKKTIAGQQSLFPELSEEEEKIFFLLKDKSEMEIDMIVIESGLSINKAAGVLLQLEFKNLIKCLPGKKYALR